MYWIGKGKDLTRRVIGLMLFASIMQNTKPYVITKLAEHSQN